MNWPFHHSEMALFILSNVCSKISLAVANTTFSFLLLLLAWNIFSILLVLTYLYVYIQNKHILHIVESCSFIQSNTLWLLIGVVRPLIVDEITDMTTSTILLFFSACLLFTVSLFLVFFLILDYFYDVIFFLLGFIHLCTI